MALARAKSYSFCTLGPFFLMPASMFLRKLREMAGTDSMMCGLVSRMAMGMFFSMVMALFPPGTVAMLPPLLIMK